MRIGATLDMNDHESIERSPIPRGLNHEAAILTNNWGTYWDLVLPYNKTCKLS